MKVSHHIDARGPALKVKCYNVDRDVPDGAEGTDGQQLRAYDDATRAWWHGAELIARRHGFRKVWAAGRMGGWLYTEPMPEPPTDDDGNETGEAEYPVAFVTELSAHLARAPEIYADTLAEIIAHDASEAAAATAAAREKAASIRATVRDIIRDMRKARGADLPHACEALRGHLATMRRAHSEAMAIIAGSAA